MRRSFTLIELIFSMIIIALAFSVIPKVLQISSKTSKMALKEEALYNAFALMGLIKNLPWDEQNNYYDDILLTQGGKSAYRCDRRWDGYYRRGGFVGSRNCINRLQASPLGMEGGAMDDIDDFTDYSVRAEGKNLKRQYELEVDVSYVEDMEPYPGPVRLLEISSSDTTNTKYITIQVHALRHQEELGQYFGKVRYHAHNIGQILVNKIPWDQ
ncbi:MAG: hypothetical protein C6H99_02010 [Epsilonproteobacteria bacterium]|nr:hypothetical protein [Campylobacterota bacterium]NPA63857.1 type II secretion system protein [Campylobacterota bacterium]